MHPVQRSTNFSSLSLFAKRSHFTKSRRCIEVRRSGTNGCNVMAHTFAIQFGDFRCSEWRSKKKEHMVDILFYKHRLMRLQEGENKIGECTDLTGPQLWR